MEKVTLYTAVPLSRLKSIRKHGLLTNDKLMNIAKDLGDYDAENSLSFIARRPLPQRSREGMNCCY